MDFIIDGNAYLNVAISVTKNIAYKDKTIGAKYYVNDIFNEGKSILKEEVKIQFRNFCLNYLNSLIAPVGNSLSRVHLVFDSKSWRKNYIRDFFQESNFETSVAPAEFTYKGNRKKDDQIHLFFEYFQNEIAPKLVEETGINYYRIGSTEGDDIIAYLCEVLNGDIMVYTVDSDIKQLTHSSKNNIIVIYPKQMAKHKKLCVPEEFNPSHAVDETDNFFSLNESHVTTPAIDKTIKLLKGREYVEYVVDPVLEVFTKIFRGDKKDNIPKMDKMTPSKTDRLISSINKNYGKKSLALLDKLDDKFISFIIEQISVMNKVNDLDKLNDIRKHFIFNAKIIRLSSSLFPDEVKISLKKNINTKEFRNFSSKKFNNLKNNPSLV